MTNGISLQKPCHEEDKKGLVMGTERACSCHVPLEVLKDNNSLGDHLESPYGRKKLNDAVFDLSNENNVSEKVTTKEKKPFLYMHRLE